MKPILIIGAIMAIVGMSLYLGVVKLTTMVLVSLVLFALKYVITWGVRDGVKQALDHHNVNLGYLSDRVDEYITPKIRYNKASQFEREHIERTGPAPVV